jgi:CheY-like chemotaxis protein
MQYYWSKTTPSLLTDCAASWRPWHAGRGAGDGSVADQVLLRSKRRSPLDIGLPGIDGFEVVRRLRRAQRQPCCC